MRRDEFAVRPVQNIEEPVLVGLDHHLADLAVDRNVRQDMLVRSIDVIYIIGRILIITGDLAGFWPDGEYTVCVETIQPLTRSRIVRLCIPHTPVNQVELRIVGPGAPGRTSALTPGIAPIRPRFRTGLARRGNGVSAP